MIKRITKITWNQHDGKMGYCFHVVYKKYRRTYSFNDNLPMTVVNFLLEAACKVDYISDNGNKKIETFTMAQ